MIKIILKTFRIPEMEELHNFILEILEKIQQLDSESALRDEGILSAIERYFNKIIYNFFLWIKIKINEKITEK